MISGKDSVAVTLRIVSLLLCAVLVAARPASATSIGDWVHISFTGTLVDGAPGFLPGTAGEAFTGVLAFDPSYGGAGSGSTAWYDMTDPLSGEGHMMLSISTSDWTVSTFPFLYSSIGITNLAGGDRFTAGGEGAYFLSFGLSDSSGGALTSTALPTALNLSNWAAGWIAIGDPRSGQTVRGVVSVPEPDSVALFAVGGAALMAAICRRRRGFRLSRRALSTAA